MLRSLFLIAVVSISYCLNAATIRVCSSCDFKSISSAVNSASPHDIIQIESGTYPTHELEINIPITLKGMPGAVLDGENNGEIIIIHSDSVNILDLTIKNVGSSYVKDWAAISSDRANYCRIENNKILDTFFGLYIRKSSHFTIANNQVISNATAEINSGNAIHLWHCDSMLIENNEVLKHRDGIYFEFVKNSIISNNISRGNVRYGLHFMFSDYNKYLNNTFEDNGSGVAVMYGSFIEMKGNTFINNWGPAAYGLLLKEIKDGDITNNTFKKNTTAIYAEGAMRMNIYNNKFESNGWAMKILASCMENVIKDNNFIGNSFSVFTNSPRNYNEFTSNYWSAYKGYDLDHDGFGDVPHRPVSLFTFIVEQCEPALLLMKSNFIALLEIAERAAPSITPEALVDNKPRMKPIW